MVSYQHGIIWAQVKKQWKDLKYCTYCPSSFSLICMIILTGYARAGFMVWYVLVTFRYWLWWSMLLFTIQTMTKSPEAQNYVLSGYVWILVTKCYIYNNQQISIIARTGKAAEIRNSECNLKKRQWRKGRNARENNTKLPGTQKRKDLAQSDELNWNSLLYRLWFKLWIHFKICLIKIWKSVLISFGEVKKWERDEDYSSNDHKAVYH